MTGTSYSASLSRDALDRVRCHYGPDSRWARLAGQRLQAKRRTSGLSAAQFLARTGLSKSTLSRIENGAQVPPFADMVAIAHVLDLEVDQIWPHPTWPEVAQAAYPAVAA